MSRDTETASYLAPCPVPGDITFTAQNTGPDWVDATLSAPTPVNPPAVPITQDKPPKHYVVVRTDMPLHVQMVQVAHACLIAGDEFGVPEYAHLCLVSVIDEEHLIDIEFECSMDDDIVAYMFHEPDDNIGYSALVTGAIEGPIPAFLRRLPLWKYP